jgi:MFS family permease
MQAYSKGVLWSKNFVRISIANLFMATGFYFLIPTLPVFIVDELGAGPGQVGYILGVYTLSALLIRPFAGYAADAWGRKWIYLISFLLFTVLLGFYVAAYSFAVLLLLRFIQGFTWGAATTSSSVLVVDIVPPSRRGEGIGIYGLSFTLAMAVGPMIALSILKHSSYNLMFASSALVAGLGFLIILGFRFPAYEKPAGYERFSLNRIIEPRTLPMALVQLVYGLTYGGLMTFITLYAKSHNIENAGVFFMVFAAGIAVSRIISGRVFDRRGPAMLMAVGLTAGASGFVLLGLTSEMSGFVAAAILAGVCMGVVMPSLQAMANNVVEPQRRGAANATFISAFDIGIGGGAMLLGLVAEMSSLEGMFLFSALLLLIALVIFFAYVMRFYKKHTHL